MPDTMVIAQFERRLLELGCPSRRLSEKVCELAEHHEDLKQEFLALGLSEAEAEARASARLGDPLLLAENAVVQLRQSSWWGRHPFLGFCIIPALCYFPVWLLLGSILIGFGWLVGQIFGSAYAFDSQLAINLGDSLPAFDYLANPLNAGLTIASLLFIACVLCWLARRSAIGPRWTLFACACCAIAKIYSYAGVKPHTLFFQFQSLPQPYSYSAAIPILIGIGIYIRHRKLVGRLADVPMDRPRSFSSPTKKAGWFRRAFRTPTYWIVLVLTGALSFEIASPVYAAFANLAKERSIRKNVWPAERLATLALIKKRQVESNSSSGTTINLKPFANADLSAPLIGTGGSENNLNELPRGTHVFGGVTFHVDGIISLAGAPGLNNSLPGRIRGIPIGAKATTIHLLHGASDLDTMNVKIARLILHYEGGSTASIPIISGEHALDWWGPIYNTDSGIGRYTKSAATELAWAGSNPRIHENAPDFSLRLYKSSFPNPHPELKILTIDYVSTESGVAPFLVGLTVN